MDTNIQIQSLKSQIDSMKLQINNIEIQNNNMINSIGDQLLILSIQMFTSGIKTFNTGKKLKMSYDKYIEQIKNISEQITNLINSYNLEKQQQMMQQQMMQQQMMQQQMMQQQMMQQQMMQQQLDNWKKVNVCFRDDRGRFTTLAIETDVTIKSLLDKYMEKVSEYENSRRRFIFNATKIKRYDNTKIKDYFSNYRGIDRLPTITVYESEVDEGLGHI